MCELDLLLGNHSNGHVFHDNGGTVCVMEMLGMKKFRRMALRLITQLIMLDGTLPSLTHPLTFSLIHRRPYPHAQTTGSPEHSQAD